MEPMGMTLAEASAPLNARILVADDEDSMRFLLREAMSREGYAVECVCNGHEALQKVREEEFDLLVMDVKMPQMDGLEALRQIKRIRPELIVVMITAFDSSQTAMEAVRCGAYDYFSKPFELEEMRIVIRRALEKQQLLRRISNLERGLQRRFAFDRIIGQSDAMREMLNVVQKVITNDVTVLITGESGTGKELVAQAIHYHSRRKSKPFISVNCAAIPETLLESELFGHEKGAFTGAVATKIGRFEAAEGGTIFLDEIGDMPLALQSKLLRVLQEREIIRVGGIRAIKADIRVIAATNQNLVECVEHKRFREDLYFRLNVLPIHLPPLRKRKEDVIMLAEHFIAVYNPRLNRNIRGLSSEAIQLLTGYSWPGNVRELENVIQRAMILASSAVITEEDLPENLKDSTSRGASPHGQRAHSPEDELISDFTIPLQQKVEKLCEELEKRIIMAALRKASFHRQDTADLLGISRKSLHNKMVKYQMFDGEGEEA